MIKKNRNKPEKIFEQFVLDWFELISKGQWNEAFAQLDLPPTYGKKYTPELFRHEIENDHFCQGTVYRKNHPEITYTNPKKMAGNGRPSLYKIDGTSNFSFEFDVPLNNEFSDLTSGWEFIDSGESYKVRLDFLHVL
mgnify:CR=1 FL=1